MRISDWSSDVCSSDLELMWSAGVELLKPLPASGTLSQRGSPGVQVMKSSNGVSAPPRLRRISLLGSCIICFRIRSEEHTSELQSLMRISYAVFCLNKKKPLSILINKTKINQDKQTKYIYN